MSATGQECETSESATHSSPLLLRLNLLLIDIRSQLARIHKPLALVGPQAISRHGQCLLVRGFGGAFGAQAEEFHAALFQRDVHVALDGEQCEVGVHGAALSLFS